MSLEQKNESLTAFALSDEKMTLNSSIFIMKGTQSLERTTHNKLSFLTLSQSVLRAIHKSGYNLTLIANSDLIRRRGSHISAEILLIQVCFYVIQQNLFDEIPLCPRFPSNCLIYNMKP